MQFFKKLTSLLGILLTITTLSPALAQDTTQVTAASNNLPPLKPQVITHPDGTTETLQVYYCPAPSTLVKNGLYWGVPNGGWKSYGESFDTSITSFVGAQWVGINVGKMICIYKGNLALSFSITLQNDILAQAPTGLLWGKDLGGYRNCHSTNLMDCPFVVKTKSANIKQIYESLDFFKGKPNPLNQNGL